MTQALFALAAVAVVAAFVLLVMRLGRLEGRLAELGQGLDTRLDKGLKTTQTAMGDVLVRLAVIDEAQKRISELSTKVVSLQELLADRTARGAFGEVQLAALVRDTLPESGFRLQCDLSNGARADCVLYLPAPIGSLAVDAKFPLDNYRRMLDRALGPEDRKRARREFASNVQGHIQDVARKYIIPGETAEGALLFVPAESVFAEIHGHHPELVELARKLKVWIASPSTLMAILTTAQAVLKDVAMREQVHTVQQELVRLAKDFHRFRERMDALAAHLQRVGADAQEVQISAAKIVARFDKIERMDLGPSGH